MPSSPINRDDGVIEGFGAEWSYFDQSALTDEERRQIFQDYFSLFPWDELPEGAVGVDVGCGSGRWAAVAAPLAGVLHCVDPSDAIDVAKKNLSAHSNVEFHRAGVDDLPFADESLDFAYCLGVLHHVPDPLAGLRAIRQKLKPGAPFLVYIYYAFENRPWYFRAIWRLSDLVRRVLSRLPFVARLAASQIIAVLFYWPLARTASLLDKIGCLPRNWPLAYYRDKSFYIIRADALDRFGTRLEHRFTRVQIHHLLKQAGFRDPLFSDTVPYWCAVTRRETDQD